MGQLVLINLMLRLIVCWVSLGLWCDSSFPLVLSQVGIQGVIWLQLDMLGPIPPGLSDLLVSRISHAGEQFHGM